MVCSVHLCRFRVSQKLPGVLRQPACSVCISIQNEKPTEPSGKGTAQKSTQIARGQRRNNEYRIRKDTHPVGYFRTMLIDRGRELLCGHITDNYDIGPKGLDTGHVAHG